MKNKFTNLNFKQKTIKRFSFIVILFITILSAYFLNKAFHVKTHYGFEQFQPKNHQILKDDVALKKTFNIKKLSPYSFVLNMDKGSWLDPNTLNQLQMVTDQVYELEQVEEVLSLSNVDTAFTQDDSFGIGSLSEVLGFSSNHKWPLKDPLIAPHLISKDEKNTAFIVTLKNISVKENEKVAENIRTLIRKELPQVQITTGGPAAIKTDVTQLLSKELVLFVSLSLIGALFTIALSFKGLVAPLLSLFIILMGNIFVLGFMSLMGIPFTILSSTVPILTTITIVAISTHTMIKISNIYYHERSQNFKYKLKSIKKSVFSLVLPHFLTALTTAVGFITLMTAHVPMISDYGLTVALGVLISFLTTIILLPCLLVLTPIPRLNHWPINVKAYVQFITKHSKTITTSIVFICMGLFVFGQNLNWSALLMNDLPSTNESKKTTDFISENLGGAIPLEIMIQMSEKDFWKKVNHLNQLDQLTLDLRKNSEIKSLISTSDFLKAPQENKRLPASQAGISESYFMYSMAQVNPLTHFIDEKYSKTRLKIMLRDLPDQKMSKLLKEIQQTTLSYFPQAQVKMSGLAATAHPINREISKTMMYGFFEALVLVFLLLSFVFKSFKWSFFALLPNLVPPMVLMGFLALTNTPIKPGIAIIFAISLGIAFDNTVYILGQLKTMLKKKNTVNVGLLLEEELKPCLTSSLALTIGFSVFLFSFFEMNKTFGAFMLLSILSGLVGDLLLLPSLLLQFPQFLTRKFKMPFNLVWAKSLIPFLAFFLFIFSAQNAYSKNLSAQNILDQVEKRLTPPTEEATLEMKIKSAKGTELNRKIVIKRKNSKGELKAIVRIMEPKDIAGLGVFTSLKNGEEEQWLYLPSTEKTRRILKSSQSSRFLDSDLSYEDLSLSTYKNFKNKIIKKTKTGVVIESVLKPGAKSSYKKIHTWINTKLYSIEKSKYYNKKNKLVKSMTFQGYKRLGKNYLRAKKMTVEDLFKKSKTVLTLKAASLKNIKDSEISRSSLEDF